MRLIHGREYLRALARPTLVAECVNARANVAVDARYAIRSVVDPLSSVPINFMIRLFINEHARVAAATTAAADGVVVGVCAFVFWDVVIAAAEEYRAIIR